MSLDNAYPEDLAAAYRVRWLDTGFNFRRADNAAARPASAGNKSDVKPSHSKMLALCLDRFWFRLLALSFCFSTVQGSEPYALPVPLGLDEFIPMPEDNPCTAEKVELGRQLFFDKRLSRDGTVACATCHIADRGFADGNALAVGIGGRKGRRNAPSIFNRAYGKVFFWDGRAKRLEDQPLEAILNPLEMDLTMAELANRLNELNELNEGKSYRERFEEVFGQSSVSADTREGETGASRYVAPSSRSAEKGAATAQNAARAIAAFVRTLLSGNSPFDRYEHGDPSALSEAAKRGLQIFRSKGNCIACHSGPLLSDEDFHNTGVSWGHEPLDLGRFEVTHKEPDRGKFKVPTLRNLALTAPYMHDGSLATLEEVVDFYGKGAQPNPNLDREIRPLDLTAQEKTDLLTFLRALSGGTAPVAPPKHSEQP